jgi:hypothetical protein
MTEEKKEEQREIDFHSPDFLLQHLVSIANTTGLSMGVTLTVGGVTISGQLTGGEEYFALLKEAMLTSTSNIEGVGEAFGKIFDKYAEIYTTPPEETDLPTFIHLKQAKMYLPGQAPMPSNGLLWRGRISTVAGFSLGSFSVT